MHISLRKATEDDYLISQTLVLALHCLKNSLHRLFLCVTNKSACIQQDDINGNILPLGNNLIEMLHLGKDMLCIYLVLGTAQGNCLKFLHAYSADSSDSSSRLTKSREA